MKRSSDSLDDESRTLIDAILEGDYATCGPSLERWAAEFGYPKVIEQILEPAMEEIGRRWEAEQISLAAGYLAGKVAEELLQSATRHQQALPLTKGPVIIGNIEDDYHSLGRKMLKNFLEMSGWRVIDLGNDVDAETFVEAAVQHQAHVIGVSAMMLTTAHNIIKVRREIDRRGLQSSIRLAVGGAVFKLRPELVKEVGGDGTASQATKASALFEQLQARVTP